MEVLILISMIFCHIVDDYYLQGILASMKQKEWWKVNASEPLYKYDYIMALFMHSFSWACSIMVIPTIYVMMSDVELYPALIIFIINVMIHMFVDNLKANEKLINLVTDQCIHLCQIFVTWFYLVL